MTTNTHPEEGTRKVPKKFNPVPFAYHEEIEVEVETLTNLGDGLGRVGNWVIMVPFALPGERVVGRIWHNAANFSRADLVRVLRPSSERISPRCPLFGHCGGCQYQNLAYNAQLAWKTRTVAELLKRLAGADAPVNPCFPSPQEFHYRSKITPHFQALRHDKATTDFPIGFLATNQREKIVDIPACPIATKAINEALPGIRAKTRANKTSYKRGATILIRETAEGIVTDPRRIVTERLTTPEGTSLELKFPAGDFFQNNPYILPAFTHYALSQARNGGSSFLLDAYCGSGLFALAGARYFKHVTGIEVNAEAVRTASLNAQANNITNCDFIAGSAERIFEAMDTPAHETTVLMDPPRRGSDSVFLQQLIARAPNRVVYVSCSPDTQMRDLKILLSAGYFIADIQPFDLFPQTRHIENILTLQRK
ncbi:MAG: class I SAM-dependent RNA methyltransferase [Puniceicoccales bacterium]|jgi:23S rRNA (uracil1939-C5)-methyltransferase/tRNA (uracil-5-)-methyltransferase|nr:class I SAM-dependent RNA methyltransferase [Puniceicoccales bacterium]